MNVGKESSLKGYRCRGDVTFDLNGTISTDIGWALFEVLDGDLDAVRGVIGTYNNYATLQLVLVDRAKRPCHLHGVFDDGVTGAHEWTLNNIVLTAILVRDVNGFAGFRATVVHTTL